MEKGNFERTPHPRDQRFIRDVKAPRELVFEAFTKAEHLVHWWPPKPFTMPTCEVDLRPGGSWRYSFRSPEGQEHQCEAKYLEVDPPRRIVMTQAVPALDGKPVFMIRQTVSFQKKGEGTELVMDVKVLQANPGSEPFLDGMSQGTNMTIDNLVQYISKVKV